MRIMGNSFLSSLSLIVGHLHFLALPPTQPFLPSTMSLSALRRPVTV